MHPGPTNTTEHPSPRPKDIVLARWRESVIRPALDCPKGSQQRGEVVEKLAAQRHVFPNGREGSITTTTLYNWIRAFEINGFKGLIRKARSDRQEYRVHINRAWDSFFASRITPAMIVRIQEELDDAICDFWEEIDATWRMVCLNSSEWLLHRTAALQDDRFAALPIGCNADGSAHKNQYGLCRVNRTRANRNR